MIKNDEFIDMILDDSYMSWLDEFMKKYEDVDDLYFVREWSRVLGSNSKKMIRYFKRLFIELNNYYIRNNDVKIVNDLFYLKYKDKYFEIRYTGECYGCVVFSKKEFFDKKRFNKLLKMKYSNCSEMIVIDYDKLKRCYSSVLEETSSEETSLDEIINKIMDKPREFYIKVYSLLTDDEKIFIINSLLNKGCSTCTFNGCVYKNYDNSNGVLDSDCKAWINEELVGKSKVLKITDVDKLR